MMFAIYARVSTKDQNIDTQLSFLRTVSEKQDLEIYKEYVDVGESGSKTSRPALNELMGAVRNYKVNGVLVYKLDRIGRSLPHLISLFEEFENKGVQFISATQNINTTTPEGKMFMRMLMVLSEYERELTVDRIRAGLRRAKKEGKKLGRPRVKVNMYEVLRERNKGLSMRQIAKNLDMSLGMVQRCIKKVG